MSKPTNSINKIKDTQDVVHEIVPHSLTDGNYQVNLPELKSDIVVPYNTLQGVSSCYDTSTTDTAGTWTVSIPNITELTEGLTIKIRLKTSYNGTINTLNVNGLGAKTVYFKYGNKLTSHYGKESVLALTYTSNAISSGTDRSGWIIENIYDSTNTYQLRKYYSRYTTKSALYRYMICFVNKDNLLIPANNVNNSTANNKTLTTDSFDLSKGIYYYNSTTTVAAGGLTGTAALYQQIGLLDLRYSFNTGTTLTANKPVYLVVTPSGGYGEVILATNPIAQELPTASDGNRYVFLGYAYDTYRIELTLDHPIYVYNSIKETYISEDYSQESNIKKNTTDILNINTSISNLENNKVSKSGDTMTGSLTISSGSITAPQYNDAHNWPVIKVIDDSITQISNSYTSTRIYSDTQPEWWLMGSSQGVLALKSDIPSSLKNPNALSFGSKTYDGSTAQTITASDLGAVSKSDAITSVTWANYPGTLTFKDSTGTTKSIITLPISQYTGTNYGECWTINAPNLEYSMQIGASGFTVDGEYPGAGQEYNILQVTDTTFTYKGNNILHANNTTKMASFYSHSESKYVDIRTNQGSSTTNGVVIIATGTITLAGETTISLTHSMPNTNYALFFTQVNSSTSATTTYVPIIRSKGTKNFKVFIGSGGVTYNYLAIYVG